jgi:hypothetical protein
MGNMNKLFNRLLPLLQIIHSGVKDINTIKQSYAQICDKEWHSSYALDKAFIRDIKLLVTTSLIDKNSSSILATTRLKRVFKLSKNIHAKLEIFKIYISTTHFNLLDGEHESVICENLSLLDSLILDSNESSIKMVA